MKSKFGIISILLVGLILFSSGVYAATFANVETPQTYFPHISKPL